MSPEQKRVAINNLIEEFKARMGGTNYKKTPDINFRTGDRAFQVMSNMTRQSELGLEKKYFKNTDFSTMTDKQADDFMVSIKETEKGYSVLTRFPFEDEGCWCWKINSHFFSKDFDVYLHREIDMKSRFITKYDESVKLCKGGWIVHREHDLDGYRSTSLIPEYTEELVTENLWKKLSYRDRCKAAKIFRKSDMAQLVFGRKSKAFMAALTSENAKWLNKETVAKFALYETNTGNVLSPHYYYKLQEYILPAMEGGGTPVERAILRQCVLLKSSTLQEDYAHRVYNFFHMRQYGGFMVEGGFEFEPVLPRMMGYEEIHIQHMRDSNQIAEFKAAKENAVYAITYAKFLDTFEDSGIKVCTPETYNQVRAWGKAQNHCLAGYAARHGINGLIYRAVDLEGNNWEIYAEAETGGLGYPITGIGHFQGKCNVRPNLVFKTQVLNMISRSNSWRVFLESKFDLRKG